MPSRTTDTRHHDNGSPRKCENLIRNSLGARHSYIITNEYITSRKSAIETITNNGRIRRQTRTTIPHCYEIATKTSPTFAYNYRFQLRLINAHFKVVFFHRRTRKFVVVARTKTLSVRCRLVLDDALSHTR